MARKKKAAEPKEDQPQYRTRKVSENVRHEFTDHEITKMAKSMANSMRQLDGLEEQKKSVMADFKARIEKMKAVIDADRQIISQGYEMREVACEVRMNYPEAGMKQLFGPDGEPIRDPEKMEEWEKQEELRFTDGEPDENPAPENVTEMSAADSDDQSSEESDDIPWMTEKEDGDGDEAA